MAMLRCFMSRGSLRACKAHLPTDAPSSAQVAGLRYVAPNIRGIQRVRTGTGFRYVTPAERTVRDPKILSRIRALVIPPAWREVWICPMPDGHVQATGRDTRGRKQYRYHPTWREVRDETKYDRMLAFGAVLPKIRRQTARHLALAGMPREKILATVVRLLEATLIRVGNDSYARDNDSFGLTTSGTSTLPCEALYYSSNFVEKVASTIV